MMNEFVPNNKEAAIDTQKRVLLRKYSFNHFRVFLFTSLILLEANIFTNFHHPYNFWWCLFPILAWGSLVLIHTIVVSYFPNITAKNWEIEKFPKTGQHSKTGQLFPATELTEGTILELEQMEKIRDYKDEDLV